MAAALFVVLLALVLRAPFFTVDVIDWDESTFILMGDAWARGALPYTELWDNKPPLCFAPFAVSQLLWGKSIVAVRLLGVVAVSVAGLAMLHVGRTLRSESLGVFAGAATVALATFASRGQATMSETLAIAPLALAAVPHLTERLTARSAFISGAWLSVATLIRFNLALVGVVLLGWVLVTSGRRRAFEFAVGGALPLLLMVGVYAAAGEAQVFWASVFVAPFAYALRGLTLAQLGSETSIVAAAPLLRSAGPPPVFWVFALATAASIGLSGGGSAHYWIQIHPFSALLVAYLLAALGRVLPRGAAWSFLLLIPLAAVASDTPWERIGTQSRTRRVVTYLESQGAKGEPVLFLSEHLAHWWLDSAPVHPMATHPSNLFRPELIATVMGPEHTPARVLREIFDARPLYVAREQYVRRLDDQPEAKAFLESTLDRDYALEKNVGGVMLYRRRGSQSD